MTIWTKAFWKATFERMVRGAAVAIFGVWFVGDVAFDTFNMATWEDVGALAIGGAFSSLLLCLIGGAFGAGDGPALTGVEELNP